MQPLSPSDIALLDDPDPQPSDSSIKIPKVEENPFSPDPIEMDTDMFPPLPTADTPAAPQTMVPLPNGPVRFRGVYYQLVPAPHNVVVATSSVSAPNLVAMDPTTILMLLSSCRQAQSRARVCHARATPC